MSAVADVLNGAADLIERDGWCQGRDRGPHGECCADYALRLAAGYSTLYGAARDALLAKVRRRYVATWNDAPRQTKAKVVHALRSTASRVAATERES